MVLLYVVVDNTMDATRIAKKLLENKLLQSIRILPETWSFKKEGDSIKDVRESVLMIETKQGNYTKIENLVMDMLYPKKPVIYSVPIMQLNQELFNILQNQAIAV